MKIRNFFLTLLFSCFSLLMFAQGGGLDVVYLKDGTRLRGRIQEYIPNESLQIEVNGRTLNFEADQIKRIINNSGNADVTSSSSRSSTASTSRSNDLTVDEVHLKDGSVIRGEITDLARGEFVEIVTDGRKLRFEDKDIRRIISGVRTKQERRTATVKEVKPKIDPAKLRTTGVYNVTYLSFSYGQNLEEDFSIGAGVHSVTGKQFSNVFGLGVGVGIDNYRPARGETVYPLYLDYRLYPSKKDRSYYLNMSAGYGFAFTSKNRGIKEAQGGPYLGPSVGYRSASQEGISLNMELGYKYQTARFVEESQRTMNDIQIRDNIYNRIVFRLGLMFWGKKK